MIEKTVFTEDTIISVIKSEYNIDVFNINKLNRGSANLYVLNDETLILKEFQSKYTKQEIDKEIAIINHLKNDGLPVPEYIKTVNDNYSFIYKERVVSLQKFIKGYTIESNTATYDQMIESASQLGKIAKSLETLDIELPYNDINSWYSPETFDESLEKLKKLLEKVDSTDKNANIIKNDIKDKIEMIEFIRNNCNFDEMKNLTIMNTHGDYSLLQFIYNDGHITAVIDFVSACKMPIVWEIIRSYSYIDSKANNGEIDINNLTDYVKEFCKYVKLNKYDLKYMSYLYLVQLLSSTFGYKQYIADNSKIDLLEFAFFRTKMCKNLFENADIIGIKLEEAFV